jgi:hypothetical protein
MRDLVWKENAKSVILVYHGKIMIQFLKTSSTRYRITELGEITRRIDRSKRFLRNHVKMSGKIMTLAALNHFRVDLERLAQKIIKNLL